jgi:ribosomal protein S18 acetylase RimI-like enzyme
MLREQWAERTELPPVPPDLTARGVALRERQAGDAAFLRDVYVAYRWGELSVTGWPDAAKLAFLHDQHRLQDAHYSKWYAGAAWGVIEVMGKRAGRIYLLCRDGDLRIVDIALMPEFCNQGIGSGLLRAVQHMAEAAGARKVSIHVERHNPALRLYRRLGFHEIDSGDVYYLLEWPVTQEADFS